MTMGTSSYSKYLIKSIVRLGVPVGGLDAGIDSNPSKLDKLSVNSI